MIGRAGLILFILTIPSALLGQSTAGSIAGTIADPQDAVIVGARVALENVATGIRIEVFSDAVGGYSGFPLSPGRYDVRVTAPGFREKTISGVRVDLDSKVRVDVTLALEAVQEAITVEAQLAIIQRDT